LTTASISARQRGDPALVVPVGDRGKVQPAYPRSKTI
jgi:hypothetical protein